jgi:hypothetical protein
VKIKVGYIVASHEVTESGKPIGYFYREEPENEDDSGWRVFSGEESQAYVDDPTNLSFYNASTIVELEPDLAPFLALDYPIAFERDASTGEFVEIDDDDADD